MSISIKELSKKLRYNNQTMLGLMSGTSLDGLDIVEVEFIFKDISDKKEIPIIRQKNFKTYKYDKEIVAKLNKAINFNSEELSNLDYNLGKLHCKQVKRFISEHKINSKKLLAMATHGHTIAHKNRAYTIQIGNVDYLSQIFNITIIDNFRSADIAAGGAGAPLVPYLDYILVKDKERPIAMQNLGGIGNVTLIDENNRIKATDTGPANMMSNSIISIKTGGNQTYDNNGELAKSGKLNKKLLLEIIKDKKDILLKYPTTLGAKEFGYDYCKKLIKKHDKIPLKDLLATTNKYSAITIRECYKKLGINKETKVFFSGGGIYNKNLIGAIKNQLEREKLDFFSEEFNISDDAKEAVCFAMLGLQRLRGVKTNIISVTKAKYNVLLGRIT